MATEFVPVDLDQVLDEFEEQERHQEIPQSVCRPNSLDLPNADQSFKPHSVSDTRTYSFNSPLDAMLKEHSKNIEHESAKSLAQELADLNIVAYDHDDIADNSSDTSSTTAIITAAEKIEVDFTGEKSESSNENKENNFISTSKLEIIGNKLHDELTEIDSEETDFLSLLNSVVDENPFHFKESLETSDTGKISTDRERENACGPLALDTEEHSTYNEKSLDEAVVHNKKYNTIEQSNDSSTNNELDNFNDRDMNAACNELNIENNYEQTNQNEMIVESQDSNFHLESSITEQIIDKDNELTANTPLPTSAGLPECNSPNAQSDAISQQIDGTQHTFNFQEEAMKISGKEESRESFDGVSNHETINVPGFLSANPQLNAISQQMVKDFADNQEDGTENIIETDDVVIDNCETNEPLLPTSQEHDPQLSEDSRHNIIIDNPSAPTQTTALEDSSLTNIISEEEVETNDDSVTVEDDIPQAERTTSPEPVLDEGILPVHISSGDPEMGFVPPIWVPDEVASHCMTCGLKFSLIKRKHHCRACGRVLCSTCCNMKYPLPYLGNKEARVCQVCCDILLQGSQNVDNGESEGYTEEDVEECNPTTEPDNLDTMETTLDTTITNQSDGNDVNVADGHVDSVENGQENVSTTSLIQASIDQEAPSANTDVVSGTGTLSSGSLTSAPLSPALSDDSDLSFRLDIDHVRTIIPQDFYTLPPVLKLKNKVIQIQERPDPAEIMHRLKGLGETVIFLLNKNLIVKVKIVKLKCCVKKKCWCFVTDGMGAANQEEMVVLLECEHNENTVPKDVLSHFNTAFTYAMQGHVVSDLGFTIFGQPFLGSSNNAGFLYIRPTFQCLENLPLPAIPYVVGILIQRQEAPWAQLFPIRLMLRLGTEFRYYPCPLWSVRNRTSVYHDVGHTIMNLLADFKNFQYSIPRITGLVIHMEDTTTTVRLPQDRFDEVIKVLNAAEEHMFVFGANFSKEADSHLVCLQEGESYTTQSINIQNTSRKVTGASFVVFTGSLKTSYPNDAKVSIIEDGIMIQILPDAILGLRKAIREMQDYVIKTGSNASTSSVTQVNVEWVSRDTNKQMFASPIDGRSLTDVPSIQVHSSCDFSRRDIYRIRWTNVFLERNGSSSRGLSSRGLTRLTGELARACCEALRPYLAQLFDMKLIRLSLRVDIDSDSVEYNIGANQQSLPTNVMADLDSALIPSINAATMKYRRGPLTVELFFSVISLF